MKLLDHPHAAVPHIVLFCCQLAFAVMQGDSAQLLCIFKIKLLTVLNIIAALSSIACLYGATQRTCLCRETQTSCWLCAVASKVALDYIPPFPFAAMRVGIAVPLLWGFAKLVEPGKVPCTYRHFLALAGLGITGVVLPQGLIFVGIRLVGPDIVAIMQPTIPVLVVLLTSALGYERLTLWKSLGVVSSVGGAVVMLDVTHIALHSSKSVGMLVMLIQVLSYAVFITALSRYLKQVPLPFTVCFWISAIGCLCLSVVGLYQVPDVQWHTIPGSAWAILFYAAIGVSFLAHGSISWAVKHVPPSVPSLYTCCQPLTATILSAVVYGDTLQLHHIVGMILILSGLFVTVFAQRAEQHRIASVVKQQDPLDKARHTEQQLPVVRLTESDLDMSSDSDDQDHDTAPLICISDHMASG
eukprot:jgi/Ulvmu1/4234/UM191_0007.1